MKCSHTFNLLDSRGAVSVSQRAALILRIRKLAYEVARLYLLEREAAGWPLLRRAASP